MAVVAQAVWSMGRASCLDALRVAMMALAACFARWMPAVAGQVGVLVAADLAGSIAFKPAPGAMHEPLPMRVGRRAAIGWLVPFASLLVLLPLLQAQAVPRGWIDDTTFLAGYGAAQAVPGPLFTFVAFDVAAMRAPPSGWAGGVLCLGRRISRSRARRRGRRSRRC